MLHLWKLNRNQQEIAIQIVVQTIVLAVAFTGSICHLMLAEIGSGGNNSIESFEDAVHFLWSVVTTVGYGHKTINTRGGRINVFVSFLTVGLLYRSTECLISRFIIHELGHRVVTWKPAIILIGILLLGSAALILVVTATDDRSIEDSTWFAFITITTIGLGDQLPPTGWLSYVVLGASSLLSIIYCLLLGWKDKGLRCIFNYPIRRLLYGNLKKKQSFIDDSECPSRENLCTSRDVLSTGMIFPLDEVTDSVITIRLSCRPSAARKLAKRYEKKLQKSYPDVEVRDGPANDYADPGPFISRKSSVLSHKDSGRGGSRFEMTTIEEASETIISTMNETRPSVPLIFYQSAEPPDTADKKTMDEVSPEKSRLIVKRPSGSLVGSGSQSSFQDNCAYSDNEESAEDREPLVSGTERKEGTTRNFIVTLYELAPRFSDGSLECLDTSPHLPEISKRNTCDTRSFQSQLPKENTTEDSQQWSNDGNMPIPTASSQDLITFNETTSLDNHTHSSCSLHDTCSDQNGATFIEFIVVDPSYESKDCKRKTLVMDEASIEISNPSCFSTTVLETLPGEPSSHT